MPISGIVIGSIRLPITLDIVADFGWLDALRPIMEAPSRLAPAAVAMEKGELARPRSTRPRPVTATALATAVRGNGSDFSSSLMN